MSKLIKNSLSNKLIICNTERKNRKYEFKTNEGIIKAEKYDINCPLCMGNEEMTPKETFSLKYNNIWLVRSIPNKYPILFENNKEKTNSYINGEHEVLVETNRHDKNYYNMTLEEFKNILNMYLERYKALNKNGIKYISIIKNHLKGSGASLKHSHSQIISMSIVPPVIIKELKNSKKYLLQKKVSYFDDWNRHKSNIFLENEFFYAFVPDDSQFSIEINIVSKNKSNFEKIENIEMDCLSKIIFNCFQRLKGVIGYLPFNMYLHTIPIYLDNEFKYFKYHFHIIQRKWFFGGFELSTGIFVNSVDPTELSKKLKKKLDTY